MTAYAQVDEGCTHVHAQGEDGCGYVEGAPCTHEHGDACGEGGADCAHEHDDTCGYIQAVDCTHQHDENCGGLAPDDTPDAPQAPAPVVVAAFDPLPEDVAVQGWDLGEVESADDLNLPDTLIGEGEDGGELTITGVEWGCEGFEPSEPNIYSFTATLPQGYAVAEGVSAPTIMVVIRDGETPGGAVMPMVIVTGSTVEIEQGDTATAIKTAIETAFASNDIVTVTGSRTGASPLELTISPEKKVVWQAEYTTTSFTGNLIRLTGGGTFEIASGAYISTVDGNGVGILATGNANIVVSGGLVTTTGNGNAISCQNSTDTITVSGGTVSSTGSYYAIRTSGSVDVQGGRVSATTGSAIYAEGTSSMVTVSGADTVVEATGDSGYAIRTGGNVDVQGGRVSATTGYAIHASGNVDVQGGTVSTTTGFAIYAIGASGMVTVSGAAAVVEATEDGGIAIATAGSADVQDGTVSATTGRAIWASGASGTVTVSGGRVSATTGRAIFATGASTALTVSGGRVSVTTGEAIYASGASGMVTVSGAAAVVEATEAGGYAIATAGSVEVKGGAVSATTGRAISASGATSTVAVSGGTVENAATSTNSPAIYMTSSSNTVQNVTISGTGKVKATADGGYAIFTYGSVEVKGGTVSATTGIAIYASGASSTVAVSDGTVENAGTSSANPAIYMLNQSNIELNVAISGTGAVQAKADGGYAIRTYGSVAVSGEAEVTASTGGAISAEGATSAVTVSGGTVENAATSSANPTIYLSSTSNTGLNVTISGTGEVKATADGGYAIRTSGSVDVQGGTVSATTGIAISTSGASSTVTVSGAATVVEATEDGGGAISTGGSVDVQGGRVSATTGDAIYAAGASSTVTVSGASTVVEATEDGGVAIISTAGSVNVQGGRVSATTGRAIWASGATSMVTVSGGTVENAATSSANPVIHLSSISNAGLNVTISGTGEVKATADGGYAIITYGSVDVQGGRVSATTGVAIYAVAISSTVTVSGGLVFAYGSDIIGDYNVIYIRDQDGFTTATGTGVVVAWDSSGTGVYPVRSATDITKDPTSATAYWYTSGSDGGIQYENNTNVGFIPLAVTVNKINLTADDLNIANPVSGLGKTYNGAASTGVGAVTCKQAAFTNTTGGVLTVYYTGSTDGTSYTKSTTPPTNAGSYAVTVEVSGGTEYSALTGASAISLGSFTIGKAALAISGATIAAKTYDGTTAATVTAVTFTGDFDSMALNTHFTATGAFDNANAGTANRTATVTVTLGTAAAGNYTLSTNTFDLTGQTIGKASSGLGGSVPGGNILIIESNTTSNTLDLSEVIQLTPASPGQTGTASYALGTFADGGSSILSSNPSLIGATLTYQGTGKTSGTATQVITITTDNYTDIIVTITFEATERLPATVTATAPADVTYGQTLGNPSASASAGGSTFTYSYSGTIAGGASYGPTDEKPTKPGSYTVTATLVSDTYKGSDTAGFTIEKKTLTWNADGRATGRPYNGSTIATVQTAPTLNGVIGSDVVSVDAGTIAFASDNAGASVSVTALGWGITGTNAAFYNAPAAQPVFPAATISKITLTWNTDGAVDSKPYDGTTAATVATQPTLNGIVGGDSVIISTGTAAFASDNVGSGIAVAATGWGIQTHTNYNAPTAQPVFASADITKAIVSGVGQTMNVRSGQASSYTFDLTMLLPLGVAADQVQGYGFADGSEVNSLFSSNATISGGSTLTVNMNSAAAQDNAATIAISFTSGNYSISNAAITINIVNKDIVTVLGVTAPNRAYNGAAYTYTGTLAFINTSQGNADVTSAITAVIEYSTDGTNYGTTAPTNVGDYWLRISGAEHADYAVTPLLLQFSITKTGLTAGSFTYAAPASLTYDGSQKAAAVAFNLPGKTGYGILNVTYEGTGSTSYSSATPPTDAGSYRVLASTTGATNYTDVTGLQVGTFTIAPAPLTGSIAITEQTNLGTAGKIDVGDTLGVDVLGLLPAGAAPLAYQWYVDGVAQAGQASATYLVPAGSTGKVITVAVTAGGNYTGSLASGPVEVGKIILTGSAAISGNTKVGSTATLTPSSMNGTYTVVWLRDGAPIPGASAAAYTLTKDDLGKTITAKAVGTGEYSGEIVATGGITLPNNAYTMLVNFGAWAGSGDFEARASGDYADFAGQVYVGGVLLDVQHYTHASGSTIITLKESYLNTLANGTYSVEIVYVDGVAYDSFVVNRQGGGNDDGSGSTTDPTTTGSSPQTGDTSSMGLWVVLLVVSLAMLGAGAWLFIWQRRRQTE